MLAELRQLINTTAMYHIGTDLTIPVSIIDARICYGRTDCKVTPVGGTGERWVTAEKITPIKAQKMT